jgi:hypothetical protein
MCIHVHLFLLCVSDACWDSPTVYFYTKWSVSRWSVAWRHFGRPASNSKEIEKRKDQNKEKERGKGKRKEGKDRKD